MKHVEVSELLDPIPVTRSQKLKHLAQLVRRREGSLYLYSNLEFMSVGELRMLRAHPETALGVAASDPEFQAQGLSATASVDEVMRFLSLTKHEAHTFSCDCGGRITNSEQADRIERLAS